MAHKRKDTVGQHKVEHAKHLRPWQKRLESKAERRVSRSECSKFLGGSVTTVDLMEM